MGGARLGGASVVLTGVALAVLALGSDGCSSSSAAPDAAVLEHRDVEVAEEAGDEAAEDAPADAPRAPDGGGEAGHVYDGTTGQPCTSDAQCRTAAGINDCSTDAYTEAIFPTPVCLMPGPCSTPDDDQLHYCDGPDEESSPGVCYPASSLPKGEGLCFPKCTFGLNGGQPQGCQGKDACVLLGWTSTIGVGICFGGCTENSDCPGGQKCATNEALCEPSPTPPTLALGAACASTTTACDCFYNDTSGIGFCTQVCLVGGSGCPAGWVCDAGEPTKVFSQANVGLEGSCLPACSLDGGAPEGGSPDAGACPLASTCQSPDVAGPDCQP
jgi:hypothetical protein